MAPHVDNIVFIDSNHLPQAAIISGVGFSKSLGATASTTWRRLFRRTRFRTATSIEDAALSSMTARATSTGTSNGGSLRRIAFRYCRNCRS
jgi:hypothetical protein